MNSVRAAAAAAMIVALGAAAPVFAAGTGGLTLTTPAPLAKGNAALPRIASPATPATAKINAALAQLDAAWRSFRRECAGQARATSGGADTSRTVTVAMAGPNVLSLAVHTDSSCGGAYPNANDLAFAYDLATGRPLDWSKLLPAVMKPQVAVDTDTEGTRIGTVASPQLHALYLAAVKADAAADADLKTQCADVLGDEGLALQLWPDAKQDAVMVEPFGLPHAVAACAFPEPIHTADLRKLGVNAKLLDAIDIAHAAGR